MTAMKNQTTHGVSLSTPDGLAEAFYRRGQSRVRRCPALSCNPQVFILG
ncbi:hypothetical protein [Streptomyces solincola]|nr:hypothetical protein [Streptomyces solincola]